MLVNVCWLESLYYKYATQGRKLESCDANYTGVWTNLKRRTWTQNKQKNTHIKTYFTAIHILKHLSVWFSFCKQYKMPSVIQRLKEPPKEPVSTIRFLWKLYMYVNVRNIDVYKIVTNENLKVGSLIIYLQSLTIS